MLIEADGRRFDVKYATDCALMQNYPTPSNKVRMAAERKASVEAPLPTVMIVSKGICSQCDSPVYYNQE